VEDGVSLEGRVGALELLVENLKLDETLEKFKGVHCMYGYVFFHLTVLFNSKD
jgi:hypothetical protein